MKWYYAERKKPFGPIDEKEFRSMIDNGIILPDTLVWRSGMKEWKPLSEVSLTETTDIKEIEKIEEPAETIAEEPEKTKAVEEVETDYEPVENLTACSKCGKDFDRHEMIFYQDEWICPSCNAIMTERPIGSTIETGKMEYADFWVRAGAKIIDIFILWTIGIIVTFFLGFFVSPTYDPEISMTFPVLANLFQLIIAVSYTTYFLGKYSATPGKMACHLKVVTPDGGKVSYSRACYRYFAEIISSLIFGIGYLIAIFDIEKRTLHDRIAGTRVVRNH
jgi:uncharacterized RDD family membrane protein YckC